MRWYNNDVKGGGVKQVYYNVYDHCSNGLGERCNRTVLRALRKLKLADRIERWWTLIDKVERVINGNFHKALRRTPFGAYYGTMQVQRYLEMNRQQKMIARNVGRWDVVEEELSEGNQVLVYKFE